MLETFFSELGQMVTPQWWSLHWWAIFNVLMIDLVLAGDNAIVVGLAASRVDRDVRGKVIFWGIAAAVIMRIGFAAVTQQLLLITGLLLAGGILLLWVCWKMYRQIATSEHEAAEAHLAGSNGTTNGQNVGFWAAVSQIAIADISMSLDNVLAVAGAAKESVLVLVIGLAVAVVLMAVASHMIASLLVRYPVITWIGLAIILYVAVDMVVRGLPEVIAYMQGIDCKAPGVVCAKGGVVEWIGHFLGLTK